MFDIKSKVTIELLGYFFVNPNTRKYINEIAKNLNIDPSNIDKKLKELEKEGILLSDVDGNQRYYFLNKNFPLLKEYIKIYNFKYGFEVKLKSILKKQKGVESAYIFGSYVNGKFENNSDIDILVVGSHSSIDLIKKLNSLEKSIGREINAVNYDMDEFLKKRKKKDEFIVDIFSKNIVKII